MKKFLTLVLLLFILGGSANALSLSPSVGNQARGATATISIYATPGTVTDTIAMVKLSFVNATVLSFTKGPTFNTPIGTCTGGVTDNSTNLCFDIYKSAGYITSNELIGTISVRWADVDGTASITRDSGNGYYNGSVTTPSTGVAGTYTLLSVIPNTPFAPSLGPEVLYSVLGLSIAFLGIYLLLYLRNEKKLK